MNSNITDQFIDLIYSLNNVEFPDNVIQQAKKCLIDYLAVCFAGSKMAKAKISKLLDDLDTGADKITLIGLNRKAGLETAALVNGICSHIAELDDGSRFGAIHPGSPVFSALLPVAEKEKVSAMQLFKGAIIGYETAIRLSSSIQPSHYNRGYHPTGTCGSVGAAVGIAAMLDFNKQQMKDTLSAAAISAGGTLKVIEKGSELKPFNVGRAAALAVMSAYMASAGFTGPEDALGGENGYISMMTNEFNSKELLEEKDKYCIENVYFKPYAACRHAHPSIEAVLDLKAKANIDIDEVESVHVMTYDRVIGKHDHTEVNDVASAKMSIPYGIAVALLTGKAGILEFKDELIQHDSIQKVLSKIKIEGDSELSKMIPQKRSAILTIRMKNWSVFSKRVDYPKGEPENPMSKEDVNKKFKELSKFAERSDNTSQEILSIIWNLKDDLDDLFSKM